MLIKTFAERISSIVEKEATVIGLAAGGSWITNELDDFSDLDLVLVTQQKVGGDKAAMLNYAHQFGTVLSAFTGEHVGEPRLLICLYDEPFLHVDIKFVTLEEFCDRIENPVILFDRDGQLHQIIQQTTAEFPYPDFQWIEDRFWVWIHYALLKTGRVELTEAIDFIGFLRMTVLGPLFHIKNGNLPRGVRKVETMLAANDLAELQTTFATADRKSVLTALSNCVSIYRNLSSSLFPSTIVLQHNTSEKVMAYLLQMQQQLQ
jgi:hypothetical protein